MKTSFSLASEHRRDACTHTHYRYIYTKTKQVKTVTNYIISQGTGAHIDTHAKDKTL